MRRLGKALGRTLLVLLGLVVLLLLPVLRTEVACRGTPLPDTYRPILTDPALTRAEGRTYTTYPEWHIVHAYDDYAKVIASGDPHDFGYLRAIRGFWSSLCPLAVKAGEHGGFTGEQKATIYTIGVSFTAELLAKAAYEETLGRAAALVRGAERSALDDASADMAARYASFLQQTPWYRWDFAADRAALATASQGSFRDRERRLALGIEFGAKAAYARAIGAAVAATGFDELTLTSIVSGMTLPQLEAIAGVKVVAEHPEGYRIETPRYRAFTAIAGQIAAQGGTFVEIAGNDDILLTAITPEDADIGALFRFPRQGYGDWRHLVEVRVPDLAATLKEFAAREIRVEHVHDY
jgi:hypothetical protein